MSSALLGSCDFRATHGNTLAQSEELQHWAQVGGSINTLLHTQFDTMLGSIRRVTGKRTSTALATMQEEVEIPSWYALVHASHA